jgi:hypothetical protein
MPQVQMPARGKGVGATAESEAFSEMVWVEVTGIAQQARPEVHVGTDDVRVRVVVDRREQAGVGAVLERLLQDVDIHSTVIDQDSPEPPPTPVKADDQSDQDQEARRPPGAERDVEHDHNGRSNA